MTLHSRLRRLPLLALALLSTLLTGCARSVVTTTINADGSMTRKSQFKMMELDLGLSGGGAQGAKTNSGPKLADFFTLPGGSGWTTAQTKDKGETVYTATRAVPQGEPLRQDIIVLSGAKQKEVTLVNEATVREVAPGRLEYREVLHWKGKPPTDISLPDKELTQFVTTALPPALATPDTVSALGKVIERAMVHLIFGPSEPMLMQFFVELITFPEVSQYRLSKYIGGPVDQELQRRFGTKLTQDERYAITQKIIANMLASLKDSTKSKSSPDKLMGVGGGDKDSEMPVGLTFVAKLPGKIVETNGEADPYNHQVFWALYSTSAAYGDVVLTATCEVDRKTAQR